MASALTLNVDLTATGNIQASSDITEAQETVQIGSNSFDSLALSFSFGTGDNQAKNIYCKKLTVTASGNQDLDLAGGITNNLGETITFTQVKLLIIAIDSPDGTKVVRVGPQSVSNAWQGPFGDTSDYLNVHEWQAIANPNSGGWTVTAGTGDILRIHNPGGSSVDVHVLIVGME